ncbi:hypothetical protein V3C99_004252, partial [Haemonchus contortus]
GNTSSHTNPGKADSTRRLIISIKQALYKAIGRRILTMEQLHTPSSEAHKWRRMYESKERLNHPMN